MSAEQGVELMSAEQGLELLSAEQWVESVSVNSGCRVDGGMVK